MTTKKTGGRILAYIRELSIVVLGIAITLTANDLIYKRNNKRDIDIYLHAIKVELEDNLKETMAIMNHHRAIREYGQYLSSDRRDTIDLSPESIAAVPTLSYPGYKTSAFDMLKSSGIMHLLQNKTILSAIWETYNEMEGMRDVNNNYMKMKESEMFSLMLLKGVPRLLLAPSDERMLTFLQIDQRLPEHFEGLAEQIKNTIALLE